jgi:hypothetical protein
MRWKIVIPVLAVAVIAVVVVLIATGGQSKADKAMADVCDARAGIAQQVDTLKGLTPSTVTADKVKGSLQAIGSDMSKIASARADLSDTNSEQVKSANQEFATSVRGTLSTVGRSTSVDTAKADLSKAAQNLAATYQTTYGKIDCS